ncbi:MAG TPA: hypothetical protein VK110_01340 [Salinisphaeraceae bacterium]|nr:hypothetical protein [Salinisphaeraceae bacterium]
MMAFKDHKMELLAWWLLLFLLYLALLSSFSLVEIGAGAAAAASVSMVAVLARRAEKMVFKIRLRWWRWLPALLVDIALDMPALGLLLGRSAGGATAEQGQVYHINLPPEPDPHVARTRRALAAILLSAAPGSYVFDSRGGECGADVLTIHCVGGHGRLAEALER